MIETRPVSESPAEARNSKIEIRRVKIRMSNLEIRNKFESMKGGNKLNERESFSNRWYCFEFRASDFEFSKLLLALANDGAEDVH